MTFIDKLEPYVISEDPIVQEFVMHILNEYPEVPSEWANRLLEGAIHFKEKRVPVLMNLKPGALDKSSMPILLELNKAVEKQDKYLIKDFFLEFQPEWVVEYEEELKSAADRQFINFCHFILTCGEEELWEEYGEALAKLESSKTFDNESFIKAKHILNRLIKMGWYDRDEIALLLREELNEPFFSFKGILAVRAIGLLKAEEFISFLGLALDRDDDSLMEEAAEALGKLSPDRAMETAAAYVLKENSSVYAISVLKEIKTAKSSELLASFYPQIDEEGKALIIEALCHQLSERAFPLIEDYLEKGYESHIVEMEPIFYSFYHIMGKSHPYMERWKRISQEREEDFQTYLKEKAAPQVKAEKVGRNDPCPCGSGKKYKKCCGQ